MADWTARLMQPAEQQGEFVVLKVQAEKVGEEPIGREFRTSNGGEEDLRGQVRQWIATLNKVPELLTTFGSAGVMTLTPTPPPTPEPTAEATFVRNLRKYTQYLKSKELGLVDDLTADPTFVTLRTSLRTALAANPEFRQLLLLVK